MVIHVKPSTDESTDIYADSFIITVKISYERKVEGRNPPCYVPPLISLFHFQVMIRSWHFSLFTVVISCAYPEVNRLIRTDEETTLEVEKVKGVSVHFPDHSLPTDFEASVKVFYADDPTMADEPCERGQPVQALATPVVMFGPHGVDFAKDVNVQLPLPDCDQIMHMFDLDPKLSLKVYQSSTGVGEDVTWEPCNVELKIKRDESGAYYVIFPVRHFSWYKGVWDILASTLHGAKVGVSYFYPYIRFSMMCTAMMDETADNRSFGLEVSPMAHRLICS